jgi:hypothetical protein
LALAFPPRPHDNQSMNLRHAVALALVGWYLLMPPTTHDHPSGNVDAPLAQWAKRPTTYRDKAEREHVLDQQRRLWNAKNRQLKVRFYKQGQCVAANDPRLKEK